MKRIGNGGALIRMVEGIKVKRCAGCKVNHPLSAFSQGTGPGWLHRHCREYQKAWRAKAAQRKAA